MVFLFMIPASFSPSTSYRQDVDLMKALAVIAVIFFHIGILPNGFVGVDVFLAINGCLVIPPMVGEMSRGSFRFLPWIRRRLFRIWPVTLAATIVCLVAGYFTMIPGDYENLAESVVASDLFANNILSAITVKNYWNVANEFKPLMQMWYLGVIVQLYFIVPALLFVMRSCFRRAAGRRSFYVWVLAATGLLSMGAYLLVPDSAGSKFYLAHYRAWEFVFGGVAGLACGRCWMGVRGVSSVLYLALMALMAVGARSIYAADRLVVIGMPVNDSDGMIKMILTVAAVVLTCLLLTSGRLTGCRFLQGVGRMSLSLFVWHQAILAFVRYSIAETMGWSDLAIILAQTALIAWVSYHTVERVRLLTRLSQAIFFALLAITLTVALLIYRNAGVVRDVPELDITLADPYANRNTEYTDRVYWYGGPFTSDKPHVLVVGNSFARDFGSIVLEYDKDERLELGYSPYNHRIEPDKLAKADYVFFFGPKSDVPPSVFRSIKPTCVVYGIGTKYYGKNFGIFYARRHKPDYLEQTIPANALCDSINAAWRREWGGDRYIDIMEASRMPDGRIRLFTPDGKVMSYDCLHLTRAASRYLASRLGLDSIFGREHQ